MKKIVFGMTVILIFSAAYADTPKSNTAKYCWHDGKANSVGAVLKTENDTKLIRCSKVLVVDEKNNSEEVVGWVQISMNGNNLTFE